MEHFDNTIGSKVRPVRMIHNTKATIRTNFLPTRYKFCSFHFQKLSCRDMSCYNPGGNFPNRYIQNIFVSKTSESSCSTSRAFNGYRWRQWSILGDLLRRKRWLCIDTVTRDTLIKLLNGNLDFPFHSSFIYHQIPPSSNVCLLYVQHQIFPPPTVLIACLHSTIHNYVYENLYSFSDFIYRK